MYYYFSVDLSSVCNGRLDCPDKSDEIECESIIFDESYLNNVPPTEHGKKQIKRNSRRFKRQEKM